MQACSCLSIQDFDLESLHLSRMHCHHYLIILKLFLVVGDAGQNLCSLPVQMLLRRLTYRCGKQIHTLSSQLYAVGFPTDLEGSNCLFGGYTNMVKMDKRSLQQLLSGLCWVMCASTMMFSADWAASRMWLFLCCMRESMFGFHALKTCLQKLLCCGVEHLECKRWDFVFFIVSVFHVIQRMRHKIVNYYVDNYFTYKCIDLF